MASDKHINSNFAKEEVDESTQQKTAECGIVNTEQHEYDGGLQRYINRLTTMNFSFVLQSSWVGAAATMQLALINGGPASIVYGSVFSGIGTTCVAVSLAEIASMDPTVGAQYRWSATLAPVWNRFFGLMQGWITVFAWICTCVSVPALIANIITGLAIFNFPKYALQRWHSTLLMCSITFLPFIGNFWFKQIIGPLESIGAICNFMMFTASIVTLVVLAEHSSIGYVFRTLTTDVSGWTNPPVAWGIGLLTVTYPLTGFDSVIHMSDEVKKARIQVPHSMIVSTVLNAIMQFLYMITVLFTIGDVELVLADPLPITQVYYQATGSKHATNFFVAMLAVIALVSFFNCFASVSRLIWAFSRDNGLPFSATFARVHPTLKLPVNGLNFVGVCLCLLSLINIGSSTAFNAFISLPALALYISYFFPILFLFCRRVSSHSMPIPWGPFKLGRAGPFVNLVAMCYLVFMLTWMPFPTLLPVDTVNMNYAGPITAAVILGALVDWCISGRKRFQVPVARSEAELA